MEHEIVSFWKGQSIANLSREEMLDAIQWLIKENRRLQADRDTMRPHIDWRSYLRSGGAATSPQS